MGLVTDLTYLQVWSTEKIERPIRVRGFAVKKVRMQRSSTAESLFSAAVDVKNENLFLSIIMHNIESLVVDNGNATPESALQEYCHIS